MIVDCHTHIWEATTQLGKCAEPGRMRIFDSAGRSASTYDLGLACEPVDVCFVLGFKSKALGVDIPNKFIADYAYQHQDSVLAFGAIDPVNDDVAAEADRIRKELKMAGFVISPTAQGFNPTSTCAVMLYEYAGEHNMPIFIHQGPPFGGPYCEYSDPGLWASLCREFTNVKLIFTHMGWPWTDQTLLLAAEYENVYIDLAGLANRPWVGYQTLVKANQMSVIDKMLLASGFPVAGAAVAIEAIYSINQMVGSTNFPSVSRQKLGEIVECNTLQKLDLEHRLAARDVSE